MFLAGNQIKYEYKQITFVIVDLGKIELKLMEDELYKKPNEMYKTIRNRVDRVK